MPIGRIGQDFIVNTTAADDQFNPTIAALADGGFAVAWTSFGGSGDGSGAGIRAIAYNADGSPDSTVNFGIDFVANSTTDGDQSFPKVAVLPDGRFVMTWHSLDAGDGSGSCIRARVLNSDGSPDLTVNGGSDFIVNTTTSGGQFSPTVTVLADGGFVVTWYSLDNGDGDGRCIRARVYDADGSPNVDANGGNDFVVNTTTASNQFDPTTTVLADGRFLVTWYSADTGDGDGSCIRARILNADGSPDLTVNGGNDFIVNTTTTSNQTVPAVTTLVDGRFVVIWQSEDTGDGSGSCIRARIYTAGGSPDLGVNGGNDLTGGTGNDELFGGDGADLFVFNSGAGDDEIGDFVVNTDHLMLNGITIASTSEVDGNSDGFMDTLVTFSSGDTVLLSGVTGVTDPGDLIA